MKKKTISKLIMLAVVSTLLTACSNTNATVTETPSAAVSNEQATENEEKPAETTVEVAASSDQASEEDFVTVELEDGTVQITSYKGTATELVIPDTLSGKSVTSIAGFGGNEALTSITLPDTVTEICDKAFLNCSNLATVKFSSNLKTIGESAFLCTSITEIDLPDTVNEIGDLAFSSLKIANITIPTSMSELNISFAGTEVTELVIPQNIKIINAGAMQSTANLKKVTIEDGVEFIGEEAFDECSALETVTIPSSVTEIEEYAFYGCDNLTIITPSGSYAETYANENGITCEIQ